MWAADRERQLKQMSIHQALGMRHTCDRELSVSVTSTYSLETQCILFTVLLSLWNALKAGCTLDCGPSGGFVGEGMKAADGVLEESGPPDFGAPNGTAAYRAEAPLNADESLFLHVLLPLSVLRGTLRCIV